MLIQSAKAQTQAIPHLVAELCQCCDKCAARAVCRSKALVQLDRGDSPFVDASRCYGCDLCVPACAFGASQLNHI